MKVVYRKNELKKPLILQNIPQYQALKTLISNSFKNARKQWQLRVYDQEQDQQYLVESNEDYEGNVTDYKERQIKNPLLVYVDTEQDDSLELSCIKNVNAQDDKESQEQFQSSEQEMQKQKEQPKIQKQQEKEKEKKEPSMHFEQQQQRQSGEVEVYQAEQVNEIKQEVEHHPNQPQQDSPNISESSDSYIEEQPKTQPIQQIQKQTQIVINHQVQPEHKRQQAQPELEQPKEQAIQIIVQIDKREEQNQSQHPQNIILGEEAEKEEEEQREQGEQGGQQQGEQGEGEIQKQVQREGEIQIKREIQIKKESESEIFIQSEIPLYLKNNNEKRQQQSCQQYKYEQKVEKEQLRAAFSCSFCRQRDANLHILSAFADIKTCQSCQQSWLIQSKKRKVGAKARHHSNKKNESHENCSFCGERYEAMFKVGLFDILSCIPCRQKWEIVPVYEYVSYENQAS